MSPAKVWRDLEVPSSADLNAYLQEQTFTTYDTAAARHTQNPTPRAGAWSYLLDENRLYWFDGTAWRRHGTGLVAYANQSAVIASGQNATTGTVPWSAFTPSAPAWEQAPNVVATVGPSGGVNQRMNVNLQAVALDTGVAWRAFMNDGTAVGSAVQLAVALVAVGAVQVGNP